ncbi:hypothetical protein [Kitasatospora sp. NPDC001175]|uniref:hypothetical protein n=1 Tax=Kitasatospora sp. NPDC001175 TaxID=3157103 RepID=UPI003CFCF2F0
MSIPRARKALMASVAAVLTACTGLATLTAAHAAPRASTASASATAADDAMPFAIEDFAYPGAAKILQEQKITLKQGDGHIMLTDCKSAHDITIEVRSAQKEVCFAVSGKQGYVTLELPDAYGMWTEDHPVRAKITADGKETLVDAPKNDYKTFGEAGDDGKRSVLLELRITG